MAQDNILWTANDVPLPEALWKRLQSMGCRIMVEKDEGVALGRIAEISPRLWVCQVDGNASGGLGLIERVRSSHPELPMLVLSISPDVIQAVAAIKLGAADYLPAQVGEEQLWAVVERLLKHPPAPQAKAPHGSRKVGPPPEPIAADPAMMRIFQLARRIAPRRATVLIQGESGTGKEVVARYIHRKSDRSEGPFIAVNCAALPEALLESELFGHEKGAFTGAVARKRGKFELAHGGVLLLDEIGEIPLSLQAKLLRVLQEREIDRVGGQYATPVDVRVIATTNRDLEEETRKGAFRQDLFYRLNVVPLKLPPLRVRQKDIVPLARHFLEKHAALNGESGKELSKDAQDFLKRQPWPGNVRELENLMERTVLLVESSTVGARDLASVLEPGPDEVYRSPAHGEVVPLKDLEKKMIFRALQDHGGNRTHAAKVLGISVRTLRNKLREYRKDMGSAFPETVLGE
ncbi:MAG: sigma-54-dependent Fis family transcriptional regulator [Deltaproteobacteria bacterium]|nr:sigma-54-dependent Fis family transcriptional regulator [Deltaproteobacteria bacterium]MBW1924620.1 sigma-54-dependent Fis family transcriptional regulator [Deltaproteobacteria bacterium]MBW1949122.1 sigma-54-dependent Fis family transcriptional regulator [Deltaproteobacteria bacterium]MBW2007411.1 sigma-54-dependent Fis family transcriptional regulator [Deltaproteobacteria bacterium]MBW2101282.1 sigma-54-dependent Fis family transcriptional regulator [Deltaproteobacteria bacterium]